MTPLGFSGWCYRKENHGFITCYYAGLKIRVDMSCAYCGTRTTVECDHLILIKPGRPGMFKERITIAKLEWRGDEMILVGGLTNMSWVLLGRGSYE